MIPENDLTPSLLRDCVRKFIPACVIDFVPIATGKFNTSYFVEADGAQYVLRIAPLRDSVFLFYERDMMRQEPALHKLLLEKTTVPVARIIGFDDSRSIIDRDYLLMERLPGRPLSETRRISHADVLREIGAYLAQVHALTAETYGYIGEHHPMPPQDAWRDAFVIMWRKLLDDVVATGHYSDQDRSWLLGLLARHLPVFDRKVRASLLHMDIWSQNIMVSGDGKLTGLLDWDRALWGDPEIEFAVLDYCNISEPPFWEGYGKVRDTSRDARIRNLFYLLYEIQKYIVIEEGRNHKTATAERYAAYSRELARRLDAART